MKPVALVKDTSSCCGCGACLSVCPVEAITMKEDILGCQYPEINLGKCIGCEKCIQICSCIDIVNGYGSAGNISVDWIV